jgi:hypothetical protein
MSSVPRTTVNKQEMPAWRRTASAKATSLYTTSTRSAPSTRDHHPPHSARDTDGPHMRAHDVAARRASPLGPGVAQIARGLARSVERAATGGWSRGSATRGRNAEWDPTE